MSRGIIIFGPAGSGKTTLGRLVAEKLGFPYYDIDDYIWRTDTPIPYTQMYSREEKVSRLMAAITQADHFVMAGSMDSFNAPFVPLFDLAVHLTCDLEVRLRRLDQREYAAFGERIRAGGDMYEEHQRFLHSASRYDTNDASPSMAFHSQWADTLPCKVLRLDGAASLEQNTAIIIKSYHMAVLLLRAYQPEDFPIIQSWVKDERIHAFWSAGHMPWPLTAKSFAAKLAQGFQDWGDQAYICEDHHKRPVGFFLCSRNIEKAESYLKHVLVDPAQRGRGIGAQMMRLAVKHAMESDGASIVRLNVFDANPGALRCYQNAGFEVIGFTPNAHQYQNENWGRISMSIQKHR